MPCDSVLFFYFSLNISCNTFPFLSSAVQTVNRLNKYRKPRSVENFVKFITETLSIGIKLNKVNIMLVVLLYPIMLDIKFKQLANQIEYVIYLFMNYITLI